MSQKIMQMLKSFDEEIFLLAIHLALALPEEECLDMFLRESLSHPENTRGMHWWPTINVPSSMRGNILYMRGNIGILTRYWVMCKRISDWNPEFLKNMKIINLD